ncbi:MAG: ATP-binding cassette domain-containing protein [Desulfobacteraceae bacterium]|nr:ATP-binding cassette domain-containing protein [Desulfobacteraceae bacterium]
MLMKIDDLDCRIASSQILRACSLNVERGEIVSLLGRNGAGKTSTLKNIIGLYTTQNGKITFKDKDITTASSRTRVLMGIGYSPEDSRLFPELTVGENIKLGFWISKDTERAESFDMEKAFHIFPAIKNLYNRLANNLSGGEKKMVAISRALALNPSLLLLDESMEGLSPRVVKSFSEAIKTIREDLGVSVLLAESNIYNASRLADRAYIIERGEIYFEGTPQQILQDKQLLTLVGK